MGNATAPQRRRPVTEETRQRRKHIVTEILTTEQSYLEGLNTLVAVYITPLKDGTVVDATQFKQLFSNVETVANLHKTFCDDLIAVIVKWDDDTCLGPVFTPLSGLFVSVYSQYANGYAGQLEILQQLHEKNPKWNAFSETAWGNPLAKGHRLSDFLITPIQRLPRYVLLLEDLVKHTPDDHPDYTNLTFALSKMKEVANSVNMKQKDAEDLQKIVSLDKDITDKYESLVQPGRTFIERAQAILISYHLFILLDELPKASDSLVACTPNGKLSKLKGGSLKYKWQAMMTDLVMTPCADLPAFDIHFTKHDKKQEEEEEKEKLEQEKKEKEEKGKLEQEKKEKEKEKIEKEKAEKEKAEKEKEKKEKEKAKTAKEKEKEKERKEKEKKEKEKKEKEKAKAKKEKEDAKRKEDEEKAKKEKMEKEKMEKEKNAAARERSMSGTNTCKSPAPRERSLTASSTPTQKTQVIRLFAQNPEQATKIIKVIETTQGDALRRQQAWEKAKMNRGRSAAEIAQADACVVM